MAGHIRFNVKLLMSDLFDGRLTQNDITEQIRPYETNEDCRMLVDEHENFIWFYADDDGYADWVSWEYPYDDPIPILKAISSSFGASFRLQPGGILGGVEEDEYFMDRLRQI